MAPANEYGYTLLPQDDIGLAGGKYSVPKYKEAGQEGKPPLEEEKERTKPAYDAGRIFALSSPRYVLHPFNPIVQVWNSSLIMVLVVDVLVLPVETAFGYALPRMPMFYFNLTGTVLFSVDIVLQFFMQIPSPTGDYWIFNHRKIMHTYLTGNFVVDVVSVLPFSSVHWLLYTSERRMSSKAFMFRVLSFIKLLRIVRLKRFAKRFENDLNLTYTQRAAIGSGLIIFLTLHFMSCIWATMGNYQLGDDWESYVLREKFLDADAGSSMTDHAGSHSLGKYITAMYFALYTLTGIGYGDIVPVTQPEYIFSICMMLVGSLVWAMIIGEIVSVLNNAHVDEHEYMDIMDKLLKIGKTYHIPFPLQRRLKSYLSQQKTTAHRNFVHEKVISKMSSDLAIELTAQLHGEWVDNIWWLKNVSRTVFMVELTLAFDSMLYCPGEHIWSTDRLYVILHGLCIHGSLVMGKNKCFGVDFLLAQDHLRINLATVALSYLHTIYLTRNALQKTLECYPRERALVRRSYRSLCCMRGIVHFAKQIVAEEKRQKRMSEGRTGETTPRKKDFLDRIGTRQVSKDGINVVAPSVALQTRVSAREVSAVVMSTQMQLEHLEEEINDRMTRVETQIGAATSMISEFIARKQREGRQPRSKLK